MFVNALVRRVVVSHPAPSYVSMEIHWKREGWGVNVCFNIRRDFTHTADWSTEDDLLLAQLYPTAPTVDILQAFPDRTWGAIINHAMRKGVRRRIKEPTGTGKTYRHRIRSGARHHCRR